MSFGSFKDNVTNKLFTYKSYHIYMYMYMYVCMYVCMCVYKIWH